MEANLPTGGGRLEELGAVDARELKVSAILLGKPTRMDAQPVLAREQRLVRS